MSGALGVLANLGGAAIGYLSTFAYDVVAVYDQDFNQLFHDARPMKASIRETAKLMEHPVETGSIMTDHRVIMPIEIDLNMVLDSDTYLDTYYEIKDTFFNVETIIVQTSTGVYDSMLIQEFPHEENPEHYDTITMTIKFKEVRFATASTSALPATGNKNPEPAKPPEAEKAKEETKKGSALHELTHKMLPKSAFE